MCAHFNVRCILFTGVAGGMQEEQQIGDLVLGESVVNYDMDCAAAGAKGPPPCLRTPPPWLAWWLQGPRPLLRNPERMPPPPLGRSSRPAELASACS